MVQFGTTPHTWLFGRDRARTQWFVTSAVRLCGGTAIVAGVGDALLSVWPQLYAHLVVESVAVLIFAGTVALAVANAYVNDGLVPCVVVTAAPLVGLFLYLAVDSLVFGATGLAQVTLDSLITLGSSVGMIGLASYLLGLMLSLRQSQRVRRAVGDEV